MNLREQILDHFARLSKISPRPAFLDEVIRLMEWARRVQVDECNLPWPDTFSPLTLPPDDWKP